MSETAKKTRGAGLFFKIFIGYIISVLIIAFLTVALRNLSSARMRPKLKSFQTRLRLRNCSCM